MQQLVDENQRLGLYQEPVAWTYSEGFESFKAGKCWVAYGTKQDDDCKFPLYAAPPKREWVGLTDEEIWAEGADNVLDVYFARDIEAKLNEKNHDTR
jgi:hypothetical protein